MLEPITQIEVSMPKEFMGAVMGDLSSRRGKILGMDVEGALQVVRAEVRRWSCTIIPPTYAHSQVAAACTPRNSVTTSTCPTSSRKK